MGGKLTRRAALACLGSGAAALVARSYGFESVRADRNMSVSVSTDSSALLGIENVDGDPSTVPRFINNTNQLMEVTITSSQDGVEFDVGDDGSSEGTTARFDLRPNGTSGDRASVNVLANGDDIPVDLSLTLEDPASGATVGSIDLTRLVSARTQSGAVDVTPNVKESGNSGYFEFELVNNGTIDAVITGIKIRDTTNADADRVDKGDIFLADPSRPPKTKILSGPIYIEDEYPNRTVRRNFDEADYQTLSKNGGSKYFAFDKFRSVKNNGKTGNAKMKGETVYITLYFDDGSSAEKALDPNA